MERHFGLVFAVALARLGERETAEDLAQEVFLRALLNLDRLHQPSRFAAWVGQIARNLAVSWLRRRQRSSRLVAMVPLGQLPREPADTHTPGGREAMEASEESTALREALQALSASERELVLLHFAEGMRKTEIAERLGLHPATVGRRIERALSRLRGRLEPMLRAAGPALRASRPASARTVALVTAIGAMSAASKTALAAEAASTGGGAFGLLALLKSIPAMFAGGGAVMGVGKGVAVVVAVGAVAGGAYVMTRKGDQQTPAPASPAPAVTAPPAAVPAPQSQYGSWEEYARAYLDQHPQEEGLRHLLTALESFSSDACAPHSQALTTICEQGWQGPHPEIENLIRSQAPALQEALAAADAPDIAFPPIESFDQPVPNFLKLQLLSKLLVADARRLEAAGQVDQAAQRAVQAVRLADHLRVENVTLIQHLIGLACEQVALHALESILRQPGLTEATLRGVGSELAGIAQRQVGFAAAMRTESRCMIAQLRRMMSNPRDQILSQAPDADTRRAVEQALNDFSAFEAEQRRVWDAVIANEEKPFWQREPMDQRRIRSMTSNPLILIGVPNFLEAGTRADVGAAHLRLCEALCALRLGQSETLLRFPDPFSGQPLHVANDRVWSVGPDRQDQSGALSYDPTNGTVSPGDIAAMR